MRKYILFFFTMIILFNCGKDDSIEEEIIPKTYEGDIRLRTQTEIDEFGKQKYTKVTGRLDIAQYPGEDAEKIVNLDALYTIKKLKLLLIYGTYIKNVDGLKNLNSIEHLAIESNSELVNINGLSKLKSAEGQMSINLNPKLTHLDGLQNLNNVDLSLYVKLNSSLSNLKGLKNLTRVGGDLGIESNPLLKSFEGLI